MFDLCLCQKPSVWTHREQEPSRTLNKKLKINKPCHIGLLKWPKTLVQADLTILEKWFIFGTNPDSFFFYWCSTAFCGRFLIRQSLSVEDNLHPLETHRLHHRWARGASGTWWGNGIGCLKCSFFCLLFASACFPHRDWKYSLNPGCGFSILIDQRPEIPISHWGYLF